MRPTLRWPSFELYPPSQWPGTEKIGLLLTTLGPSLLIVTGLYLLLRYRSVLGSEVAGAFLDGVISPPLAVLLLLGLIGVYLSDVFGSKRVPKDARAVWAVALTLGSLAVMPVYWYLFIWRRTPQEPVGDSEHEASGPDRVSTSF